MPGSSESNVVPACPKGLAFTREDFLDDDFTIDGFLAKAAVGGDGMASA